MEEHDNGGKDSVIAETVSLGTGGRGKGIGDGHRNSIWGGEVMVAGVRGHRAVPPTGLHGTTRLEHGTSTDTKYMGQPDMSTNSLRAVPS
ncbi:unnamed protein product [Linum trigynum]|uniref:Uncharacterized protein n=1 Tax=Linum trigynum TaxID=586398 RepID=A0AAV2F6A8_9ROSI